MYNMTPEQRAAYINAQSVMMTAEMKILEAENKERENKGLSLANGPEEWLAFFNKWEAVLGHNAIIKFFYA